MSERMTDEEMRLITEELRSSIALANNLFNLLDSVINGGVNDVYEFDGVLVPSLNRRIKKTIDRAIDEGIIEIPKGRRIKELYVDDDGKMVISYDDEDKSP